MLSALLLLVLQTAPADPLALSPALTGVLAERTSMSDTEFAGRVKALAEGGDMSAAEALGEFHNAGLPGFPRDAATACNWFERASAARADAMHNLALCHETGEGRGRDPARARILYERAAAGGWVQAKCALGTMLVRGSGGAKDVARGVSLCREAAEAGNANAQTDYGFYLLMGEVVPKDVPGALRWLTAAAGQGQSNAAFVLGQMHWNGDGTPANRAEAARWWRVAYDGGRRDAASLLAREVVARTLVTAPDGKRTIDRGLLPEAIKWLERAVAHEQDPAARAEFSTLLDDLRGY